MSGNDHYDDVREARAHLTSITQRVERGDEIIIDRAGSPSAKIEPFAGQVNRTAVGSPAGEVDLWSDWDSPATNAEIAADFLLDE